VSLTSNGTGGGWSQAINALRQRNPVPYPGAWDNTYNMFESPRQNGNPNINIGAANTGIAPGMAWIANLTRQGNLFNRQNQLSRNAINSQAGFDRERLGLQRAGLGIDQSRLANQGQFIGRREGLADRGLANTLAGYGIDRERIGLNRGEANRQADVSRRGIDQDFTARGAWFAPEHGAQMQDVQSELDFTQANLGLDERQVGLGEEDARLGREGAQIGFDEARSDLGAQQQNLALQAQQLGLSERELAANVQQALDEAGLSEAINAYDLFMPQFQGDTQAAQTLDQVRQFVMGQLGI